jgi:hypothetical protein
MVKNSSSKVNATGVTIGDLSPGAITGKGVAERLGWARVKLVSPDVSVIACGGSSGGGGKASITAGDAVRNAMDVRYHYLMATPTGTVTLQRAQADHYASQW